MTRYEWVLSEIETYERLAEMYDDRYDAADIAERLYDLYEERDYIELLIEMGKGV
jgi:hypothetical protein